MHETGAIATDVARSKSAVVFAMYVQLQNE